MSMLRRNKDRVIIGLVLPLVPAGDHREAHADCRAFLYRDERI